MVDNRYSPRSELSGRTGLVLALALATPAVALLVGCAGVPVEGTPAMGAGEGSQQRRPVQYALYSMRNGDTLYAVSRRFDVPVSVLIEENEIADPGSLKVGTTLLVPLYAGAEPAPAEATPGSASSGSLNVREVDSSQLHRGRPGSRFWWPTAGDVVRHFGQEAFGLPEPGIAIGAPAGTQVCAAAAGGVASVVRGGDDPQSTWGNVVTITHQGEMASFYGHLDQVLVQEGQSVSKGEPIGTVGTTGAASEPVLAFRLFRDELPVDPAGYLP